MSCHSQRFDLSVINDKRMGNDEFDAKQYADALCSLKDTMYARERLSDPNECVTMTMSVGEVREPWGDREERTYTFRVDRDGTESYAVASDGYPRGSWQKVENIETIMDQAYDEIDNDDEDDYHL